MHAVQTTIMVQKLEKFQCMQKIWQVKICVWEVRKLYATDVTARTPVICL